MARIILGVTGSVAAVRTPALYEALRRGGHEVRVVATEASLHFFDPAELGESVEEDRRGPVFRDADEWESRGYRREDAVLHIEFRKWADLLVLAPLDANTLAKMAIGLCDNFLTCVYRAWDFQKPVVLAPAMNTLMWEHPATLRHLRQIMSDHGELREENQRWGLDGAAEAFARNAPRVLLIPPQAKRLACGDVGVGAMAEVSTIAESVRTWSNDER